MSLRLRHGGNVTPPVGPDLIYGPTYPGGAQGIRAAAGVRPAAQRTAVPSGAISFNNTTNLNTLINAYPAWTAFVGAAQTYTALYPGNIYRKHPRIWFQDGAVIDGLGTNNTWLDTDYGYETDADSGAEVYGGKFQNFGNASSESWRAALIIRSVVNTVIVEDVEFSNCYWGMYGQSQKRVSYCYFHDCLRGSLAGGSGYVEGIGSEVGYCHFKNNNTSHFDPAGATGEATFKVLQASPWLHHNWAEGSYGPGLWTDYGYNDVLIEENVVENNTHWGIFYEVGTGDPARGYQARGIIRHNSLYDNATNGTNVFEDVQILASCCDGYLNGGTQGFEISNNLIDGDRLAVYLIDHTSHPTDTRNGFVYNNKMYLRGTRTGVVGAYSNEDDDIYSVAGNNRFQGNYYYVPDANAARWHWAGTYAVGSDKTWVQWQAYGHDAGMSLGTI